MEIKTILEEEVQDELNELGGLELGSDKYKTAVDGITKLADRLIEIEKFESERAEKVETREIENNFKQQQADDERKDRLWRNGVAIAGIVVPTAVTIWGTCKTFKFDDAGGIISSTLGRGFLNKLVPKK